MLCQDFVAADLINEHGDYDPGFDAGSKLKTFRVLEVIIDESLDDNEWYFDFRDYHGGV